MISNIVLFALAAVFSVVFIIAKVNPDVANKIVEALKESHFYVEQVANLGLGLCVTLAVLNLIVFIFAIMAIKSLKKGNGGVGIHILFIIGGVLSWDIFYLLGGIFGTIGNSK